MRQEAVFEFFVRKLEGRNSLMAAGLAQLLEYLLQLRFEESELAWLEQQGFGPTLLDYLRAFRFTGDVHAMREGTIFFPDEPILRVTAPLPQAQLVETRIINLLQFQTMIASKAVRMVLAAPGKQLVDFGLRRGMAPRPACWPPAPVTWRAWPARRPSWRANAGASPRSARWPIHSSKAHDDELLAFEDFALANPQRAMVILDTYDVEAAAGKVVELARRLALRGVRIRGVRLDSGDLAALARRVRAILDVGGAGDVQIVASGNLDEFRLAELVRADAPIDGYGIGTRLDVSANAPYLECAYKLVEYAGKPRRKTSEGKASWPGRKQVFRHYDADGRLASDRIALADEPPEGGEPLLECVVRQGSRCAAAPTLEAIRRHAAGQLERLPAALKALDQVAAYPVEIAPSLVALASRMDREQAAPPPVE